MSIKSTGIANAIPNGANPGSVTWLKITGNVGTTAAGQIGLGTGTTTTDVGGGSATALPALPLGYWQINIGASTVSIPYYSAP
jgi:hypothetical protein